MFIPQCTNEKLDIVEKSTGKEVRRTDPGEVMVATGRSLIM
jgi:hypothetical protein